MGTCCHENLGNKMRGVALRASFFRLLRETLLYQPQYLTICPLRFGIWMHMAASPLVILPSLRSNLKTLWRKSGKRQNVR